MVAQNTIMLDNQITAGNLFRKVCDDIAFNGKDVTPWSEQRNTYEVLKIKNNRGKILSFKITDKVQGLLLYGHTFEPLTFDKAYAIIRARLY